MRHPTPIRRLSLMNEASDENIHASPMGMTIISPDDSSASVSRLETPSTSREVGAEIENRVGSLSGRRGGRGIRSTSLQANPLPPSSALVIPGSHSKQQVNSVSSKKSRSRRSMSRSDVENTEPTEREVKALHHRFNAIQMGLGSIDHERELLVEKSKELEKEKLTLENQLQLRDNEIHALVKRCANQEEKLRESSKLRSQNRELAADLQGMVHKLETMKTSSTDLHELKRQLSVSEHEREELQKRLDWVEKEHDAIAGTLSECLENIRKLTAEKKQLEDDRIRERQRSEMEMEKQRLNMVQFSNDLQSDLQRKQHQIDEMEMIIQKQFTKRGAGSTMSSSRDGSVESLQLSGTRYDDHSEAERGSFDSDILDARLKKTTQRYEKQIADMKLQVESHIELIMEEEEQKRLEAATAYEHQIESMRKEILETGSKEGRLFELQSKLAEQEVEIKREKESARQVREAAERYEKTIADLKDMLEKKTQEVKEKNETNAELETQIARNEMDLQLQFAKSEYESKITLLEKELTEKTHARRVLESENRVLAGANTDLEARMSEEQLKLKDLVAEHETQATLLQSQIKQQEKELQCLKTEYESKIALLEKELTENNHARRGLESEKQVLTEAKNDLEVRMNQEQAKLKELGAEHETIATLLQTQIKQQETELQFAKADFVSKISGLERELTEKNHAYGALESENRVLTDAKNDLEITMSELVSSHESKVCDLHDKIDQTETDLQHVKDESSKRLGDLKKCNKQLEEQGEILTSREEMNEKLKGMKKEGDTMMNQLVAAHQMTMASLQSRMEQQCIDLESKGNVIAEYEQKMIEMHHQQETHESTMKKLQAQFEKQETVIAEKTKEATSNKRNASELKEQLDDQVEKTTKIKKEMKQLLTEHSETMAGVASKTEKLRNTLVAMKEKLDEREERIANVENEFSEQMQEMMHKQVLLDRVEDQKQLLEAQVESLQHFEDEHAAMVHYIEIMESNCAELTADNGILNVEKESLIEDKLQLQEKIEGFEGRLTTLRDGHIAREEEAKGGLEQEVAKLREELETMNRQLDAKADEVTSVRMHAKGTLENMQVSLAKARDEIVELEDQLGWEKTLQTQPTDASEEIESLAEALEAETRRCEDLQDKIDSCDKERASLLEDLGAAKEELALQEQELERRDKRICNLAFEIDALSDNDREEAFIEAESQKLELEGHLADMRRQEAKLAQALNDKEQEIEKLRTYCGELEEKMNSFETQLRSTEDALIEKLDVAVKNAAEQEATLSAMRESLADKNVQIESLVSEMKKDKDKEVELLGKLSDAESKIVSCEAELGLQTEKNATLQKQIRGVNDSTRRRVSDLDKQFHRMKTDLALKDDEIRDLRMVDLKDAEEEISELKGSLASKRVLEQELLAKKSLATELQKTVNDLKMNQTRLLTQERDLMAECDRLFRSESEAREMLAKMESELQSMAKQRQHFEADSRSKELSQECELRKLEKEASERNEKLNEVVILSEGLAKRLALRERELEEERQELDSKREENTKLRRESVEKENSLKHQLKEERRNLEVAEQTLESMRRQKSEATKYKKQASQKEKEIEGLRDKVKRQEAYLQKKMQREKVSSRAVADTTPKPTPVPKNKLAAQSVAASHLARRRSSGIPFKPTATGGASSTPSTRRKARASLLPIAGFRSPGFRDDLD
ncbi:MAG: hypothetical protein SGBAC_011260 [Bacillariaceae sp.]